MLERRRRGKARRLLHIASQGTGLRTQLCQKMFQDNCKVPPETTDEASKPEILSVLQHAVFEFLLETAFSHVWRNCYQLEGGQEFVSFTLRRQLASFFVLLSHQRSRMSGRLAKYKSVLRQHNGLQLPKLALSSSSLPLSTVLNVCGSCVRTNKCGSRQPEPIAGSGSSRPSSRPNSPSRHQPPIGSASAPFRDPTPSQKGQGQWQWTPNQQQQYQGNQQHQKKGNNQQQKKEAQQPQKQLNATRPYVIPQCHVLTDPETIATDGELAALQKAECHAINAMMSLSVDPQDVQFTGLHEALGMLNSMDPNH